MQMKNEPCPKLQWSRVRGDWLFLNKLVHAPVVPQGDLYENKVLTFHVMNHKCIFFSPKCCKCVFDACVLTVFLRCAELSSCIWWALSVFTAGGCLCWSLPLIYWFILKWLLWPQYCSHTEPAPQRRSKPRPGVGEPCWRRPSCVTMALDKRWMGTNLRIWVKSVHKYLQCTFFSSLYPCHQ